MSRNYFSVFSSLILLLSSLAAILVAKSGQTEAKCDPVGRVTSDRDLHHPVGSKLCQGTLISSKNLDIWCYKTRHPIHVSGWNLDINSICNQARSAISANYDSCSLGNKQNCFKTYKGVINGGEPVVVLFSPYGKELIEKRPNLSWKSFAGATSYRVEVSGPGVSWVRVIATTSLPYPKNESAFQYGNVYRIQVFAERKDTILGNGTTIVNLLSQNETNTIETLVRQVKNFHLLPDEAAYLDLDSIYMSKGLINATITSLEARVNAGSHDPKIYSTLGERYLEAGLPVRAQAKYRIAAKLAEEKADLAELQKDQAKLKVLQLHNRH